MTKTCDWKKTNFAEAEHYTLQLILMKTVDDYGKNDKHEEPALNWMKRTTAKQLYHLGRS